MGGVKRGLTLRGMSYPIAPIASGCYTRLPLVGFDVHSNSTMSQVLLVRIARSGKELGAYEIKEAIRLFGLGTLVETDHYWMQGMAGWELLPRLIESQIPRSSAEAHGKLNSGDSESVRPSDLSQEPASRQEKSARVRIRKMTPSQEAYLRFLGGTVTPGMTTADASAAIDTIQSNGGYRDGWTLHRIIHHPDLYSPNHFLKEELGDEFKLFVKSQVIGSSVKLTDSIIDRTFKSLLAKDPRWFHPENRMEIAYAELQLLYSGCCDGRPVRQYGDLPDSLHSYARSTIVACSEKLTRGRIIDVIEALCLNDEAWMNKPNRNELFWTELKQRYPGCCDGHAPAPSQDGDSSGYSNAPICHSGHPASSPRDGRSLPEPKSSGCLLIVAATLSAPYLLYCICG